VGSLELADHSHLYYLHIRHKIFSQPPNQFFWLFFWFILLCIGILHLILLTIFLISSIHCLYRRRIGFNWCFWR
jgi:hypothetical protein